MKSIIDECKNETNMIMHSMRRGNECFMEHSLVETLRKQMIIEKKMDFSLKHLTQQKDELYSM